MGRVGSYTSDLREITQYFEQKKKNPSVRLVLALGKDKIVHVRCDSINLFEGFLAKFGLTNRLLIWLGFKNANIKDVFWHCNQNNIRIPHFEALVKKYNSQHSYFPIKSEKYQNLIAKTLLLQEDSLFDKLAERTQNEVAPSYQYDPTIPNRFSNHPGTRCCSSTKLTPYQLHANHVLLGTTNFICSQAPVVESEEAFWQAAFDHTNLIVDLTNKRDRVESHVQRYYPHKIQGLDRKYCRGKIRVQCVKEDKSVGGEKKLKLHHYKVWQKNKGERAIARLHYRAWPDFGVITVDELKKLATEIRRMNSLRGDKPIWIHCRAGVGRTGTSVTALALVELHSQGKLTLKNYAAVIDDLIIQGRKQRDIDFVQTKEQYELLHNFAKSLTI